MHVQRTYLSIILSIECTYTFLFFAFHIHILMVGDVHILHNNYVHNKFCSKLYYVLSMCVWTGCFIYAKTRNNMYKKIDRFWTWKICDNIQKNRNTHSYRFLNWYNKITTSFDFIMFLILLLFISKNNISCYNDTIYLRY